MNILRLVLLDMTYGELSEGQDTEPFKQPRKKGGSFKAKQSMISVLSSLRSMTKINPEPIKVNYTIG